MLLLSPSWGGSSLELWSGYYRGSRQACRWWWARLVVALLSGQLSTPPLFVQVALNDDLACVEGWRVSGVPNSQEPVRGSFNGDSLSFQVRASAWQTGMPSRTVCGGSAGLRAAGASGPEECKWFLPRAPLWAVPGGTCRPWDGVAFALKERPALHFIV